MLKWALLLGGLTVWALHFFLLYAFALIFPGTQLARTLSLIATVPALGANALLLWAVAAGNLIPRLDEFDRWVIRVAAVGAGIGFVAILWQAMPALVV